MHLISSRWRKPKGRPSKRKRTLLKNGASKRRETETASVNDVCSNSVDSRNEKMEDTSTSVTKIDSPTHTNLGEDVCSNSVDSRNEKVEEDTSTSVTKIDSSTHANFREDALASQKKISHCETNDFVNDTAGPTYTIINNNVWHDLLKYLSCDMCSKKKLVVNTITSYSYSPYLELKCSACNKVYGTSFFCPQTVNQKKFEMELMNNLNNNSMTVNGRNAVNRQSQQLTPAKRKVGKSLGDITENQDETEEKKPVNLRRQRRNSWGSGIPRPVDSNGRSSKSPPQQTPSDAEEMFEDRETPESNPTTPGSKLPPLLSMLMPKSKGRKSGNKSKLKDPIDGETSTLAQDLEQVQRAIRGESRVGLRPTR